ncbi:MAG TPA: CBS domain-containing protein [Solirubrobacteraceae bacterium]|nr:CBS domain-containing protein [Solirubrobacteraceae bacterium]
MLGTPSYLLEAIRVADVMHPGIIDCDSRTSVEDVAQRMSQLGIHALAIRERDGEQPPAIISDLDLVAALAAGEQGLEARDVVAEGTVTILSRHSLREAAHLMSEHAITHLVVIDEASGSPCGVISSTDVLAAYASVTRE